MSAHTNSELVDELVAAHDLSSGALIQAWRAIDRADFVPPEQRELAYRNHPLPIGYGQTISQPATIAFMLELLSVGAGLRVLEVGAGSGYVAALLAKLVGEHGMVTAVERLPQLVELAKGNLTAYKLPQLTLVCGDGSRGYAAHAPYDRIIVSAAAATLADELKAQLTVGGRLVAPVGSYTQDIVFIERTSSGFHEQRFPGFVFVPLVSKLDQAEHASPE